jgi:hypothetical protein
LTELEEAPQMDIIGGLDVHRKQITFDYIQMDTGEVKTGQRLRPATRERLRGWLSRFEGKQAERSRWKRPPDGASWPRRSSGV